MRLFDIFRNKTTQNKSIGLTQHTLSGLLTGFDNGEMSFKHQNEQKLINNGYGSNSIIYSIINRLVTTGADIPLVVRDLSNNEIIEKGKLFDISKQPAVYRGEIISQKEWLEIAMTYLLTSGNLYQRKLNLVDSKNFDSLEIIPSGIVEPIVSSSYLLPNNGFKVTDKQSQFKIDNELMSHTKYINPTHHGLMSMKGLSPLQAGLYSLTGSTDVQKALSVLVKSQGVRGILTNESNHSNGGVNLNPENAKRVKESINNTIRGIDKINSVHVSNASLKYLSMGMSASDLKLVELGILNDRQLCNLYGIDSRLFNDVDSRASVNLLKDATKGMYVNSIIPTLNKIIDDFNKSIAKPLNATERTNYKLELDLSKIEALQSDKKVEAEKDKIKMQGIEIITSMLISDEAKISLLIDNYDYSEENAKLIIL